MVEKTDKRLIEAFPTGNIRYVQQEENKETLLIVELEEGLLMKAKDFEWIKEAIEKKGVIKLRPYE